jgi:tetratricopeptide (TPR) repeat protein
MSVTDELKKRIELDDMELVDLVPVPSGTDQAVRYKTIQEVLHEFEDEQNEDSKTYVLQVRKRRMEREAVKTESASLGDSIYLANGKLNSEFLLRNAKILEAASDFGAARQIYSALSKSGDRSADGLLGMARCLEAEGDQESALRAYEDCVLYYPSADAYRRYASLLIRTGKHQQAAEIIERALVIKDLDPKLRYTLHQAAGNSWLKSGIPEKAERNYRKALEIDPHSDAIAANIGVLCLQQKRLDEAKIAFQEAIRVNPSNEKAWFGMGSLQLALTEKSSALDAFAQSLRLKIQQPQAIFNLVKCAYETKRYAEAKAILCDYIEVSPVNPHLLYSLAGLQYHTGEKEAARKTARTILGIQPTHAEAAELIRKIDLELSSTL